jgi:hypothetical protein
MHASVSVLRVAVSAHLWGERVGAWCCALSVARRPFCANASAMASAAVAIIAGAITGTMDSHATSLRVLGDSGDRSE